MRNLKYIPLQVDWYELLLIKDTPEKQVAFLQGIAEYALHGTIPPSPNEMENPKGVDYARRDGYLTCHSQLDFMLTKQEAGRRGGCAGTGDRKARKGNQNATKTQAQRKHNASITQADPPKNASLKQNKIKQNNNALIIGNNERVSGADAPALAFTENANDDAVPQTTPIPADNSRPLTVPSDEEMRQMATQIHVPLDYLEIFIKEVESLGWGYNNRGGSFVPLCRRNFKAFLSSFYRQHKRNEGQAKAQGQAIGVKIEAEGDYEDRF